MSHRESGSGGRPTAGHRGPGRPPRSSSFPFKTGDLVLVKWTDGMVYFAKIKKIDQKRCKCVVVFDDKSQDEAHFSQIHSVDETTTDIICIKCKKDASSTPNEIVLCDTCGIGFHQKCHNPPIPASALQLDTPWNCIYCLRGTKCPYLTESLDALQNLLSDDNDSNAEEDVAMDGVAATLESSQYSSEDLPSVESHSMSTASLQRKRKGRKAAERATRKVAAVDQRTLGAGATSPQTPSLFVEEKKRDGPDAWRQKLSSTHVNKLHVESKSSPMSPNSDATYSPGGTPEPSSGQLGKRKKVHAGAGGGHRHKRQKRSSVEARTVSVTRLSGPISTDDSSTDHEQPSRDSTLSEENFEDSSPATEKAGKTDSELSEARPRSLRVSLTFPDEVEPGTPLDKVKKLASPPISYSKPSSLPVWEEFSTSSAVTHDTVLKAKQRKISSSIEVDTPFKASPLPTSANTSPQQLMDDVFHTNQSEIVSLPLQLDVGVTTSGPRPTIVQPKPSLLMSQPAPVQPVSSVSVVTGQQQKLASPQLKPQVNKPADVPDSEKHRPVILTTTTTKSQTPVFSQEQTGHSFEVTLKPPVHNTTSDLQPSVSVVQRKIASPVAKSHISTPAVLTGNTPGRQLATASKEVLNKSPPVSAENDVIITGVETRDSLKTGSAAISPVQAQRMLIEGHRRAHELNEGIVVPNGREMVVQRPKRIMAKTVDILSPVSSQGQGAGSVVMPIPSQTPVVPMVVTPTAYMSASAGATQQTDGGVETASQLGNGKTLLCRVQNQNGQPVYIPIASTAPPSSQPVQLLLTKETHSPVTAPANIAIAASTQVASYSRSPDTAPTSLPTQSQLFYTSVPQPSVPSNGKVVSAVSGVSTTKPYAIVNALPVSSVEYRQATRPQHIHHIQPPQATKVIASPTNIVTIDTPRSAPPSYDSFSKPTDQSAAPHRAHTVVVHASSLSNSTPKVASRVDKAEVNAISKKIGDALTNMNESMLIAAFDEAWSKFQANDEIYKTQPRRTTLIQPPKQQHPPPNAEVLPGTTSRVSLIRQMRGTKPRMIAPKPFSRPPTAASPPAMVPVVSCSAPATSSAEYAVYTSTSPPQQQVVLHPVYTLPPAQQQQQQQKTYQVQTAGLYYPASVTGANSSSPHDSQQVTVLQPAPRQAHVLQTAPRQSNVSSSIPHRQTRAAVQSAGRQATVVQSIPYQAGQTTHLPGERVSRRKGVITSSRDSIGRKSSGASAAAAAAGRSNRHCARCGGDATYLCSGCHTEWYCGRECQLKAWDAHAERCQA